MTRRYEYKYAISDVSLESVLDVVRYHHAGFSEAYPTRQVNNFYLDTVNHDYFYQNMDGISRRRKFRYRWYGTVKDQPAGQLETKNKENELGWKDTIHVPHAVMQSLGNVRDHFRGLGLTIAELSPQLYNAYDRYYFESSDGLFRLTVDHNQRFSLPFDFADPPITYFHDPTIVMEIKFDEQHQRASESITRQLPFLRTKNSKYATGIIRVYGDWD